MMLGKEDFDSWWSCYICSLCHASWQEDVHADGIEWTLELETLSKQAEKVQKHKLKGRPGMGVREDPYFDIPVDQYIWPLLHTLIGIGSKILTFLVDYADTEIQYKPAIEIRLQKELVQLEKNIGAQGCY